MNLEEQVSQLQQTFFALQNNEQNNINGNTNSENEQNILVSSINTTSTSKHEHNFSSPENLDFSISSQSLNTNDNKIPFVIRLQSPNLNCQTFPSTTTFFVKQLEETNEIFRENIDNVCGASFKAYQSENLYQSVTNCDGCGMGIHERHLLCLSRNLENLEKSYWHENCLTCVKCNKNVGNDNKCFVHDGRIFCTEDYSMLFGPNAQATCTRCGQSITPTELVYRSAGIFVYHLNCFTCFCCGQQLTLGEQYINVGGQLICQREVNLWRLQQQQQHLAQQTNFLPIPQFPELEFNLQRQNYNNRPHRRHRDRSKKIPKRPRTILNAPQRKAFKYAFEKGQKPTRKVREQLARETGLSVRVVQVWFQNQRAKIKKESTKRELDKQQNIFENNNGGKQSGSSAEEEIIMGEEDSDELDVDSCLDDEEEEWEEKEIVIEKNINENPPSLYIQKEENQVKNKEENLQQQQKQQKQNPIEKLYNMHQTYFAFA